MRKLLFVGWLTLLLPASLHAQGMAEPVSLTGSSAETTNPSANPVVFDQGPHVAMPSNPRPRCCNLKGAIIGAAIGVGLAVVLNKTLCDAGDCTSGYITGGLVLGGIGAGLGALVHRSQPGPMAWPERSVPVSPTRSGFRAGVTISTRF